MQPAEGGEEGGIDAFGAPVNEIQRAKYIRHTKPSMHPFNSPECPEIMDENP